VGWQINEVDIVVISLKHIFRCNITAVAVDNKKAFLKRVSSLGERYEDRFQPFQAGFVISPAILCCCKLPSLKRS